MNYIYICNTSSDSISKIDAKDFKLIKTIILSKNSNQKIGPHAICRYMDKLLIANNYSEEISILDINEDKLITETFYVGKHCNDIKVNKNFGYILCGDENSINVLDMNEMRIIERIPTEDFPHSIDFDYKKQRILISNMRSDSILISERSKFDKLRRIKVGDYPTKAIFTEDGEEIVVCESNLGSYERGSISIFSSESLKMINKISVGFSPVDMEYEKGICYVSNFGEGTISIIDIYNYNKINKINIGGMPRSIKKMGEYLYVLDNYNNKLYRIDLLTENKKAISIGKEPTGMAFV